MKFMFLSLGTCAELDTCVWNSWVNYACRYQEQLCFVRKHVW